MAHNYEGPEARQWLESNANPAGFASNRFASPAQARLFVAALYTAGAKRVIIPKTCIRDDEIEMKQGGPYADAILAEFDPKNCEEILRIFRSEAQHEGYDEEVTRDDGWIVFWWD